MPIMDDRTIIKVPVSTQDAEALTHEAKEHGMSRGDYCRDILIRHLQGHGEVPAGTYQDHGAALSESQRTIERLEKALTDKHQDLEWTRGQLIETQRNLTAALAKIPMPPAMLTDGQHNPSWWDRFLGRV